MVFATKSTNPCPAETMTAKSNFIALTSMASIMVFMLTAPKAQLQDPDTRRAAGDSASSAYVLPPGLSETYRAYVDEVTRSADPLPSDVAVRMHRLVGM